MLIDTTAFTPLPALAGGVLIGLSAGLFMLMLGRVAGISGLLGSVARSARDAGAWYFLVGLIAAPWLWRVVAAWPMPRIDANLFTLMTAGLLVGIGTRLGSGCTSGHGVCGLSRLSSRSLAATLMFMATGFATVLVVRHLLAH